MEINLGDKYNIDVERGMGWMGRGWAKPGLSRKWHYFNNSTASLCRKWLFKGLSEEYDDNNHYDSQNCAICKRKVLKEKNGA
jgi:hypothetical protein